MEIPLSLKPHSLFPPLFSPNRLSPTRFPFRILSSSSPPIFSSSSGPILSSYSGWDDLTLSESGSDNSDPIRSFLASIGISEGKHGVLFLLGFVSALAVSRVRVSAFVVLPVSVLVFVAGFGVGSKGGGIGVLGGKSRVLEGILGELDVKMSELRNGLVRIGELEWRGKGQIGDLIEIVDYVKSEIANLENGMNKDVDFGGFIEGEKKLNTKGNRKRMSFENVASDFVKYFGGLIWENIAEFNNSPSSKNVNKKDISERVNVKKDENLVVGDFMKSEGSNAIPLRNSNNSKFVELREEELESGEKEPAFSDMISFNEELNDINSSLRFSKKQDYLERMVLKDKSSKFGKRDLFKATGESSVMEQTLEIRNRSYKFKFAQIGEKDSNNESPKIENQTGGTSNLEEFNQNLQKASEILTKAREYMKNNKYNEEKIDALLYQSATILCTAVALKPNSILALAQLGNNYLLHGELKLKISRELRSLLSNKVRLNLSSERFEKKKEKMLSKEGIASVLVEVCEECESLLIEAGRNYKKVLSIDGNDIKALYNWGLALSFRAQLISDIGPEAAIDADKVYLAAIDKFDAILSKNNSYAPEALYRWGKILQNRSHLRPRNDKEKIKLLHQAKSLFEEVLYLEADNLTVRNALSSCISELEYNDRLL